MILKNALTILLRNPASKQCLLTSTQRYASGVLNIRGSTPLVRFASSDVPDDNTPQGAFCPPGSEEFCIAGHVPGEELEDTATSKTETNAGNSAPDTKNVNETSSPTDSKNTDSNLNTLII